VAAPHASRVGEVLSADIAVPEHERELLFYSRVLTTGDDPLWREDLMNNAGTPIIGLGERSPAYADLPLQWMPHIQVADVADSVERALGRGGRELMHHKDDRGQSQWAVLLDPNGAAFGIIPVVTSQATQPVSEGVPPDSVGRIAWLDLTVSNAPATRDFYQDVVGWSVQDVQMEDTSGRYADYALCTPDGTAVAGVCHARGVNRGLPPVWLIYLPVGDLGQSLGRVREGGGEVLDARKGSGGEYAFAVVRDPVGACVALVPG
jgi:predicted enzyme related to lactoylglutathione lyase